MSSQPSEPQQQGVTTLEVEAASPSHEHNQEKVQPAPEPAPAQGQPDPDLIQFTSHHDSVVTSPPPQEKPMAADHMIVPEGAPQMVTPLEYLTEKPTYIDCPHCHQRAMTRVNKEGSSMQTYVVTSIVTVF